jgi:thiol-disulfide isomerase/thioredoxin
LVERLLVKERPVKLASTTDDSWSEILEVADGPVLIDFWAGWCGTCMLLAPSVERAADELADENVRVVKVDAEVNPSLVARFEVLGIPAFVLVDGGGGVIARIDSARTQSALVTSVREALAATASRE